jgi:serine/threonine protein phosphatase PrpC
LLRVADHAHRTDTGRQRSANEDSYFARAPVFAVADGMGGAQAGEVASKLAAEAFEPGSEGTESPETYLRRVVVEANTRIHELAESDSSHSGMGTTLTAALVQGDEISLAHVGDSRAYVYRNGELRRLTSDHSLVEELRRQGRLTEQQAEEHPQRSIITRALGPEPEVEIDTMTYPARPEDVFLLCSDGLTTMVPEDRIATVLGASPDLDTAAARLVREANEAGGRDNITVVAFRLEEVGAAEEVEGATLIGPSAGEEGLSAEAVRAESERTAAERRRAERRRAAPPPRKRSRARRALVPLAGLLVLAAIVAGAIVGLRQVYFLGSDEGGRIALYRGLPYELPFGIELYSEQYSSPVQASALPADRRESVIGHELRSEDDARSLIDDLETAARQEAGGAAQGSPTTGGNGAGGQGGGQGGGGAGGGDGGGGGATP